MRKIAYAGISLLQYQQIKVQEEIERDREWTKNLIKQMGLYDYEEFPYGFGFKLIINSPAFDVWVQALNERPELAPSHIRVERQYQRQEFEASKLLLLRVPNHSIETDYYETYPEKRKNIHPVFRRCPTCRAPLEQIRPLIVKKPLMKKRQLSLTYQFQVVMAQWVGDLFREQGLTGFDLWPVQHYTQPYEGEPTLYQLFPTNILPPMSQPFTAFENVRYCEECQRTSQFLKHTHWWGQIQYYETTDVYYPRSVLDTVKDFNYTLEWFGELPLSHREIIITQKTYQVLQRHKVKDWEVTPVYLVDE